MRKVKKITSIVLAVLMVVSMMAVMGVSTASAYTNTINSTGLLAVVNETEFIDALKDPAVRCVQLSTDLTIPSGTPDIDFTQACDYNVSGYNYGKKVIALNKKTLDLGSTVINIASGAYLSVSGAGTSTMLAEKRFFNNYGTLVLGSAPTYRTTAGDLDMTAIRNYKDGTLTINGGKFYFTGAGIRTDKDTTVNISGSSTYIETTGSDAFALCGNGLPVNGGYTINISGGTISAPNGIGVYHPNLGTLNITGGTITGATGVYVKAGQTNISGGTIQGTGAVRAYNPYNNGAYSTGEAIVFESNYAYVGKQPEGIHITGGTFETTNAASPVGSYAEEKAGQEPLTAASEFISGGTYNGTVPNEYLADTYALTDNGDGTKTAKSDYVAKVGNTTYTTFADAVTAANGTDTIVLLSDVTYALPAGNTIKVDKNGYVATINSADVEYYVTSSVSGNVTTYSTEQYAVKYQKNSTVMYLKGNEFIGTSLVDGATYTILKDFTNFGGVTTGKNTTIDLNGHTLTDTAAISPAISSEPMIIVGKGGPLNIVDTSTAGTGSISRDSSATDPVIEVKSEGSVLNIDKVDVETIKVDNEAKVNLKDATVDTIDAAEGTTITYDNATVNDIECPEDYKVQDNGDGTKTVVPKYVAKVGNTKYESLADALDAAKVLHTDVFVLADCELDRTVTITENDALTLYFEGHTVNVTKRKAIQNSGVLNLSSTNGEGGFTRTGDLGGFVETKDHGLLRILGGKYYAGPDGANNDSCAFYCHDDSEVRITGGEVDAYIYAFYVYHRAKIYVSGSSTKIKSTKQAAISGNGSSGLGGYTINVSGGELISEENSAIYHPNNGKLIVSDGKITGATGIYIKAGTTSVSGASTEIGGAAVITGNGAQAAYSYNGNGNNPTGDALVIDNCGYPAGTPSIDITGGVFVSENAAAVGSYANTGYTPVDKFVSGGTFSSAVPEAYCAKGYQPKNNGNGTYGVELKDDPLGDFMMTASDAKNQDNNMFGITSDYNMGTLLGVQKKTVVGEDTSSQEGEKNMRFVAVLDTTLLQGADDYGFVLAKANNTNKTYADINYDAIKAGDDRIKTISAKNTYNNVCGDPAYGDPTDTTGHTDYKYITCAVNNVTDDDKVIARFYYKKDGKTYYAKYAGHNYQYTGCMAAWSDLP